MAKSQDGFVARFLNRPISRAISRFLLKTPITPRGWTLSIFVLPVLASLFAQRGDYFGFVIGAALLQLFSVLDGCDGEIARARFLDSDTGGRLDKWCDVIGGFVFIFGLGLGLYRKHGLEPHAWIYLAEALACIVLITWNELRLERAPQANVVSSTLERLLYPRHRELIQHSGILFLGANAVWWIVQLTKRDLSMLVFLALAIANQAECILPLWIVITAAVLLLSAVAHRKRGANASTPAE
jgi:phosphatidylglycerophosphate synthase